MKTKLFFVAVLMNLGIATAQSENLPSMAVANPSVNGLSVKPESAAKMLRLELIKLNKYKVYDEFGGQVTDEKATIIINEVNNIKSPDKNTKKTTKKLAKK